MWYTRLEVIRRSHTSHIYVIFGKVCTGYYSAFLLGLQNDFCRFLFVIYLLKRICHQFDKNVITGCIGGAGTLQDTGKRDQRQITTNMKRYEPFASRWRNQMETFSALLALCAGNSPVTGEFPAQRPVTWMFGAFFDLHMNKRLSKQSWGWWFETPSRSLWRHCNILFRDVLYARLIQLQFGYDLCTNCKLDIFIWKEWNKYDHYHHFIHKRPIYGLHASWYFVESALELYKRCLHVASWCREIAQVFLFWPYWTESLLDILRPGLIALANLKS